MEDASMIHALVAKTYGVGVEQYVCDCGGMNIKVPGQVNSLWPSVMKNAESGEYGRDPLVYVGKSICEITNQSDPVDALSINVYIAKIQHEAMMEEKCKRDDVNPKMY